MAYIKREITVPDCNGAELKMSTPILASTVEPLPAPLTRADGREPLQGVRRDEDRAVGRRQVLEGGRVQHRVLRLRREATPAAASRT
jgi:hypothetical protein